MLNIIHNYFIQVKTKELEINCGIWLYYKLLNSMSRLWVLIFVTNKESTVIVYIYANTMQILVSSSEMSAAKLSSTQIKFRALIAMYSGLKFFPAAPTIPTRTGKKNHAFPP